MSQIKTLTCAPCEMSLRVGVKESCESVGIKVGAGQFRPHTEPPRPDSGVSAKQMQSPPTQAKVFYDMKYLYLVTLKREREGERASKKGKRKRERERERERGRMR